MSLAGVAAWKLGFERADVWEITSNIYSKKENTRWSSIMAEYEMFKTTLAGGYDGKKCRNRFRS